MRSQRVRHDLATNTYLPSQETRDEKVALRACQCHQFPVPNLICTVSTSAVTSPVSDLVVGVFLTCVNAANNRDGFSDSSCCGLIMTQAGKGALGG